MILKSIMCPSKSVIYFLTKSASEGAEPLFTHWFSHAL